MATSFVAVFHVSERLPLVNSESLSELDSLDPQKRELLEARLMGRVSVSQREKDFITTFRESI